MNRKQFITWNAAMLGSLALPFKGRAAGSTQAVAAAAKAGDEEALWKVVRDQFRPRLATRRRSGRSSGTSSFWTRDGPT
jgi:hypothetical protein